jgi:hypothetical protein
LLYPEYISGDQIDEWRAEKLCLCVTSREATSWGKRYEYAGLRLLEDDEVRDCLEQGAQLICVDGILALLEVHGCGDIEPPLIDGWGREGLVVFLAGLDEGSFFAVAELENDDVLAALANGATLLTCDEVLARFEENIEFESPPYPTVLARSWHEARKTLERRLA